MYNYNLEIHDIKSKNHIPFFNLGYVDTVNIIRALESQEFININVEILSTKEKMSANEFLGVKK